MNDADTTARSTTAGEAATSPAPADEAAPSASASSEKELLCTICGLRACWTEPSKPKA